MDRLAETLETLKQYHQEQLLRFADRLTEEERASLLTQIEKIDFAALPDVKAGPRETTEWQYAPIDTCTLKDAAEHEQEYEARGMELIREGKLAVLILAGGEGTRLGFDHPKGMLNVGIRKPLYLFEIHMNRVREMAEKAGCPIPVLIMTNPVRHGEIVDFFETHDFFGYDRTQVEFFRQDMAPALDPEGKVMLRTPGQLALSPDGNGHWFQRLVRSGLYDRLTARGLEWINLVSVDNVMQRMADPVFLGATAASGKDSGTKVVAKTNPDEKVGVVCLRNGRPAVVEYFEAEHIMHDLTEDGVMKYRFGVTLNYLFRLEALKKAGAETMPIHLSKKKIPFCGADGETIAPEEPNGFKQETLTTDMIDLLGSCLPFEVDRAAEFVPIKNRCGVDSLEYAQKVMLEMGMIE